MKRTPGGAVSAAGTASAVNQRFSPSPSAAAAAVVVDVSVVSPVLVTCARPAVVSPRPVPESRHAHHSHTVSAITVWLHEPPLHAVSREVSHDYDDDHDTGARHARVHQ